ncbi:MAG: hypothetical protein DMD32_03155 [Gemmatimonadetes bacterium]|nr:MAG: hypothetical protein DMD32_03155 [Gemmatimonadota bacterium]
MDHLVDGRRPGCTGALALHLVECQCVAVSAQRVELRELEQDVPLLATVGESLRAARLLLCAGLECQRQAEIVEQVQQHGFARPDSPLALELAVHLRQCDGVVQGMMRAPGVDAEAQREVLELGAVT